MFLNKKKDATQKYWTYASITAIGVATRATENKSSDNGDAAGMNGRSDGADKGPPPGLHLEDRPEPKSIEAPPLEPIEPGEYIVGYPLRLSITKYVNKAWHNEAAEQKAGDQVSNYYGMHIDNKHRNFSPILPIARVSLKNIETVRSFCDALGCGVEKKGLTQDMKISEATIPTTDDENNFVKEIRMGVDGDTGALAAAIKGVLESLKLSTETVNPDQAVGLYAENERYFKVYDCNLFEMGGFPVLIKASDKVLGAANRCLAGESFTIDQVCLCDETGILKKTFHFDDDKKQRGTKRKQEERENKTMENKRIRLIGGTKRKQEERENKTMENKRSRFGEGWTTEI